MFFGHLLDLLFITIRFIGSFLVKSSLFSISKINELQTKVNTLASCEQFLASLYYKPLKKGDVVETINYFTGKSQPHSGLPRSSDGEKCEECSTVLVYNCIFCGAPVCCPKCCAEAAKE